MTHPGVGPVTALATDVFLGDPARFANSKALASYVGMIPSEYFSGRRQRLGELSKQGNPLLRFLWCEAGMTSPMATTRMTPVCHEAECEPHIDACGPLRLTHPQTGLAQKKFRPPRNIYN
jgi:hypothetical protein